MNAKINAAQNEVTAYKKELEKLKGLQLLLTNHFQPGERPDLVAYAIKNGIPIPLKYMHSFASLSALFKYSLEEQDSKLHKWTTNQITQILGLAVLNQLNEIYSKNSNLKIKRSSRQQFLKCYKSMKTRDLSQFIVNEPADSFWTKQLRRVVNSSVLKGQILGLQSQDTELDTMSGLLEIAFSKEEFLQKNKDMHPYQIITKAKVSPYVYIPSLISSYGKRMYWDAIVNNEFFIKKGLFSKQTAIPISIIIPILKKYNPPDTLVNELQSKYTK